jgi:hypothetical protein
MAMANDQEMTIAGQPHVPANVEQAERRREACTKPIRQGEKDKCPRQPAAPRRRGRPARQAS